jgi:hypothetical protein
MIANPPMMRNAFFVVDIAMVCITAKQRKGLDRVPVTVKKFRFLMEDSGTSNEENLESEFCRLGILQRKMGHPADSEFVRRLSQISANHPEIDHRDRLALVGLESPDRTGFLFSGFGDTAYLCKNHRQS